MFPVDGRSLTVQHVIDVGASNQKLRILAQALRPESISKDVTREAPFFPGGTLNGALKMFDCNQYITVMQLSYTS